MTTATIPDDTRRHLWRSRWAAIGAAVAVTLGGGGIFVANAASSPASSVVTIDPVRILDTRDPVNIGLSGPFVSAISQKLQVTGAAVPVGATGALLNVTVVGPTAAGFLAVRPGDATGAPSTSSLNFNAGDLIPNSVQVGLPTSGANAGKIDITYDAYSQAGPTTEVLIDVVGYMVAGGGIASGGTDPAVLARLAALEAQVATLDAREPFAVSGYTDLVIVQGAPTPVVSLTVTAPTKGRVTINSTTWVEDAVATDFVGGSISEAPSYDLDFGQAWESAGDPGEYSQVAGTRTFDIAAGQAITYHLICAHYPASLTAHGAALRNSVLTAIFTPTP